MPEPVFSVVVPTKGRPRYLTGCLEALAALDYAREDYEVVVVNDGGGAAIEALVASFAERLAIRLAAPPRGGPAAARNAGADAAAGRFVAFTDDDCEPEPGWLAAMERALGADPDAAAGGRTVNGVPGDRAATATQIVVDALHDHFNRDAGGPRFFDSGNLAVAAGAFRDAGGFDEDFRYAEDREFCERFLGSGRRLVAAPDAIVRHMRTLTLSEFWGQHYGYGRGAWAFARSRSGGVGRDRAGVLSEIVRAARRAGSSSRDRVAIGAYVATSQAATAAGYAREAVRRGSG